MVPATFVDNHRKAEIVVQVFALGFDGDKAAVPSIDALRIALAGRACIIHPRSSYTPSGPRWRLILLLSRAVTPQEYRTLWAYVSKSFPFPVGQEASDPSRGRYVPRTPDEGDFVGEVLEGEPVDVDQVLAEIGALPVDAAGVPTATAPAPREAAAGTPAAHAGPRWLSPWAPSGLPKAIELWPAGAHWRAPSKAEGWSGSRRARLS